MSVKSSAGSERGNDFLKQCEEEHNDKKILKGMGMMDSQKFFQVTLKKSVIGCTKSQKETVRCLGLRKIGSKKVFADHPSVRGKIIKVQHLLDVKVKK